MFISLVYFTGEHRTCCWPSVSGDTWPPGPAWSGAGRSATTGSRPAALSSGSWRPCPGYSAVQYSAVQYTVGDEGVVGDLSSESIPAFFQELPTLGHNLNSSDLDFWLNSTPFWCRNHFCSLQTVGVIYKFFFDTIIIFLRPSIQ